MNTVNSGFPIWFVVHDRRGLFLVILVIFVLLHSFATHFLVRHLFFSWRGRGFDAIVGSNAHFLPEVKTPPPLLPWFSCDSFHFFSS
jgi:H+/Cl- antiporter ClcA